MHGSQDWWGEGWPASREHFGLQSVGRPAVGSGAVDQHACCVPPECVLAVVLPLPVVILGNSWLQELREWSEELFGFTVSQGCASLHKWNQRTGSEVPLWPQYLLSNRELALCLRIPWRPATHLSIL